MYDDIFKDISDRYGKATLTKKELAKEFGVSIYSIDSYISKGRGIPDYIKLGTSKNARVVFPVANVAKFLSNTIKVYQP